MWTIRDYLKVLSVLKFTLWGACKMTTNLQLFGQQHNSTANAVINFRIFVYINYLKKS